MATALPEKQWLLSKWQKNNTLAGLLILWVAKLAFTLGKVTTPKSQFFYLQNQWKDFRFNY
jgi:hypothetical protein